MSHSMVLFLIILCLILGSLVLGESPFFNATTSNETESTGDRSIITDLIDATIVKPLTIIQKVLEILKYVGIGVASLFGLVILISIGVCIFSSC